MSILFSAISAWRIFRRKEIEWFGIPQKQLARPHTVKISQEVHMYHKIMVINGPNLNMLGIRQPEVYGTTTLADIEQELVVRGNALGFQIECFQSNSEGALIDKIHSCYQKADGIILNAGAYTHYSYALRDAIASVNIPTAEVHLSDIHKREEFRHISVIKPVCCMQICGLGKDGYFKALEELVSHHVQ